MIDEKEGLLRRDLICYKEKNRSRIVYVKRHK